MFLELLIIFLISMVPLIELRGAIPVAVFLQFNLDKWLILLTATIGNLLPVPFIYFFARKFLEWGSTKNWPPLHKICNFFLKKGEKAGQKLLNNAKNGVYFALFLFVAIPFPGTGAWTGTLAASILNLDFKKTIISVMAGVLVAGIIMSLSASGIIQIFR